METIFIILSILINKSGTFDNLESDRLAGSMALTLKLLQATNRLIAQLCLEVLIVHDNELGLFLAKAFTLSYHKCSVSDMAAASKTLNVFNFFFKKHKTHNFVYFFN